MPLYFSMSTDGRFSLNLASISADHAQLKQVDAKIPHPFAPCQRQSTSTMPRYCLTTSILLATFFISLSHAFVPANKITPAEPPAVKSNPTSSSTARGSIQVMTALQMAKKKKAPAASNKIQVKMLKYVEGTGSVSTFLRRYVMCLRIIITGISCSHFPCRNITLTAIYFDLSSIYRSVT